MDTSKLHVDGRLSGATPQVNAALQVLLHVEPLLEGIQNDKEHRKSCSSLLNCMPCAFFRLMDSISSTTIANSSPFGALWSKVSVRMDQCMKDSAFEALHSFITRMRLDFVTRKDTITREDLTQSLLGKCFEGSVTCDVECNLCGSFEFTEQFIPVILDADLSSESVLDALKTMTLGKCTYCKAEWANIANFSVQFPPYVIFHCKKPLSPSFRMPLKLWISGTELNFTSCIAQDPSVVEFISMCPDGRVRLIQNEQIKIVSIGSLVSAQVPNDSLLTVIYHCMENVPENKASVNQSTRRCKTVSINKQQEKIIGIPRLDCDLYIDLPEPPKSRSVGTQTEPIVIQNEGSTKNEGSDTTNKNDKNDKTDEKEQSFISYEKCCSHKKFEFFTGFNSTDFEALHALIGGEDAIRHLKLKYSLGSPTKCRESKLSSKDRLFIFLLRLRRGLPLEELGFCFNVHKTYVGEICYAMTRLIYEVFKSMEDILFISAAEQKRSQPLVMKPFNNLRVIIDGASFYIQSPSNFQMQGNTYSDYKSHTVILFLIGISSSGSTIFCSKGFEGNMSDKNAMLKSSELLDKLCRGDAVMVDRGFEVTAEMLKLGVNVYKPPAKGDLTHLNAEQELLTQAIAAARIYVEHAIADIKDNRLLQGIIPLILHPVLPQLVYIAAYFRNFSTVKIKTRSVQVASE